MGKYSFTRPEVENLKNAYKLVSDCVEGSGAVKKRTTTYLPKPVPSDLSIENQLRYQDYLNRAVFYNVTGSTFKGLLGQIFAHDPEINLPSELKSVIINADGSGKSLTQLAKDACGVLLKQSRFGLFVDFPMTEGPITAAEFDNYNPSIKLFKSEDIINWKTTNIGKEIVYTLIVLRETEEITKNGFDLKTEERFIILQLVDGVYRKMRVDDKRNLIEYQIEPTDFNGNKFNKIPFYFCGVEDNTATPEVPVLFPLADLNIAHYRNSADYEDSCYIAGQPTPYFTGLTEEWVDNVLKGKVQLGSRAVVPLPVGGECGFIQFEPNSAPYEAMKHKEEQFLAIGAKLVSDNSTQKTAYEIGVRNTSENSVLTNIALNASDAFTRALMACQMFKSASESEVIFKLNTDFQINKMSKEDRAQVASEWMQGLISFTEARNMLRGGKVALLDDEKAKAEIDADTPEDLNLDNNV